MQCFCSNSFKHDRSIIQDGDQQKATQAETLQDISSTRKMDWGLKKRMTVDGNLT